MQEMNKTRVTNVSIDPEVGVRRETVAWPRDTVGPRSATSARTSTRRRSGWRSRRSGLERDEAERDGEEHRVRTIRKTSATAHGVPGRDTWMASRTKATATHTATGATIASAAATTAATSAVRVAARAA